MAAEENYHLLRNSISQITVSLIADRWRGVRVRSQRLLPFGRGWIQNKLRTACYVLRTVRYIYLLQEEKSSSRMQCECYECYHESFTRLDCVNVVLCKAANKRNATSRLTMLRLNSDVLSCIKLNESNG